MRGELESGHRIDERAINVDHDPRGAVGFVHFAEAFEDAFGRLPRDQRIPRRSVNPLRTGLRDRRERGQNRLHHRRRRGRLAVGLRKEPGHQQKGKRTEEK